MTNNSGKFVSTVSAKEADVTVEEIAAQIPAAPSSTPLQYVEEYFGKWWWAWLILLVIILKTK